MNWILSCSILSGGDQDRHGPHTSDYYSATRSLGRQPRGSGHVSTGSTRVAAHDPELSQHPAFRHLMPPPTSSSNVKMRPRLGQCDETPINCHYTRIYSGSGVTRDRGYSDNNNDNDLTEIYRDPVSSDSDYDTIYSNKEDNNTLLPIGKNSHYNNLVIISAGKIWNWKLKSGFSLIMGNKTV